MVLEDSITHGNQNWWERSDQWLVLAGHFWPQMVPSWSSRETTSLGYPYCGKHPMFDPALTRSIIRSHDLKGLCIPNSTRSGTGASQTQATQDWNGTLETRDPLFVSTLFLGHELKVSYPNKRNTLSKAIFREVLPNIYLIFFGGVRSEIFSMTQGLKSLARPKCRTQNVQYVLERAFRTQGGFSGFMDPRSLPILFLLLAKGSAVPHRIFQQCFKVFLDLCY